MVCPTCGKKAECSVIKRYHYKESGLDNVYLKDGARLHACVCGQKFMEIPQIERLHDAIAYRLLNKKTIWRGQEFRFLRKWVGLTAEELGRLLGSVKRGTISRWENDKIPITPATHHQMLLLVVRLREEAINERMYLEIAIKEILEKIAEKAKTSVSITITLDTIKSLPFPAPKSRRTRLTDRPLSQC